MAPSLIFSLGSPRPCEHRTLACFPAWCPERGSPHCVCGAVEDQHPLHWLVIPEFSPSRGPESVYMFESPGKISLWALGEILSYFSDDLHDFILFCKLFSGVLKMKILFFQFDLIQTEHLSTTYLCTDSFFVGHSLRKSSFGKLTRFDAFKFSRYLLSSNYVQTPGLVTVSVKKDSSFPDSVKLIHAGDHVS